MLLVFGAGDPAEPTLLDGAATPGLDLVLMRKLPDAADPYDAAEATALATLLRRHLPRATRVLAIGSGPGGDAALRHARAFGARLVLALPTPALAAGDAPAVPPDCDAFLLFDPRRPDSAAAAAALASRASLVPVGCPGLADCPSPLSDPEAVAALLALARARTPRRSRGRALSAWLRAHAHAQPGYRTALAARLLARGQARRARRLTPAAPPAPRPLPTAPAPQPALTAGCHPAAARRMLHEALRHEPDASVALATLRR